MRSAQPHVAIDPGGASVLALADGLRGAGPPGRAGAGHRWPGQRGEPGAVLAGGGCAGPARVDLEPASRKLHQRGVAMAVLRLAGRRFAVAGTHLDLIEPARLTHLDELAGTGRRAVGRTSRCILGGDLNAVPGSATWQRLPGFGADVFAAVGSGDGFTYSDGAAGPPDRRPVRRPAAATGAGRGAGLGRRPDRLGPPAAAGRVRIRLSRAGPNRASSEPAGQAWAAAGSALRRSTSSCQARMNAASRHRS